MELSERHKGKGDAVFPEAGSKGASQPSFVKTRTGTLLLIAALLLVTAAAIALIVWLAVKKAPVRPGHIEPGERSEPTAAELRLPADTLPLFYDWRARINIPHESVRLDAATNFTVNGSVLVVLECVKDTDRVVLHQKLLSINEASVRLRRLESEPSSPTDAAMASTSASGTHRPLSVSLDNATEMVHFVFGGGVLRAGRFYALDVHYTAPVSDKVLSGIYRSHYKDANNNTKWLAATQMEPTDGRRALPLYDEPQMKAKFWVTLQHPQGTTALSNGKQLSTTDIGNGWVETSYSATPKMASYLLALVVAEFEYTSQTAANGAIEFRIWGRPEAVQQTKYAAEIGAKILDHYADYFGVPYPMDKIDMVALPDFEAGAMENWGLITYREKYLLYDPSVYSMRDKQLVAVVVAHELAHMWYGNLVTMKWWDDLWLNEGFATFVEYMGTQFVQPKARMYDQFITNSIQASMAKDQLATSHPLYVTVDKALDVFESFDSISYEKGGSVIRMIESVMGKENFRKGLNRYLKALEYGSATNNDLWNNLGKEQSAVGSWADPKSHSVNITAFARPWILQMGHPVIDVAIDGNTATLKQRRFKLDETAKEAKKYSNPPFGYKWYVPVWYDTSAAGRQFVWLTPENDEIEVTLNNDGWIIVNPDVSAYARVRYPDEVYETIVDRLKADVNALDAATKSQLIDDAFSLARAGQLNYTTALRLTEFLAAETDYLPWDAASAHLALIGKLLQFTEAQGVFMKYMRKLYKKPYEEANWRADAGDGVLKESMNGLATSLMCKYDSDDCMGEVELVVQADRFPAQCKDGALSGECNTVPPVYRSTVYCEACRRQSHAHFDWFWRKYTVEKSQIERQRIIRGLMCTGDLWRLNSVLNKTVHLDGVRKQDVRSFFVYASREPLGALTMWDFFESNYEHIEKQFGEAVFIFRRLIGYSLANVKTRQQIDQVNAFLETHAKAAKYTAFKEQLEKAEANVAWLEENYAFIYDWLKEAAED